MQARSLATLFVSAFLLTALLSPPALCQVSVLTQHGDNARTGANIAETVLTPANVKVATFGKLFTRTLDANVNGQVLYVPNLTIGGAAHNVIFAYTSNNSNGSPSSLYAFDADSPTASAPLWRHQFPASAGWTTCTPVIDAAGGTIYVLSKSTDDNGPTLLHALNLFTGAEKAGSPVTVAASVAGTGDGSVSGTVSFATSHANDRPGLLLLGGVVYISFAHNSDSFPYHGWVLGYRYSGTGFTRTATFCTAPNGGLAGIWMAGQGLAADASGNIYCTVGNGTFDANTGGTSYGMSVLKLTTPNLTVADWFAPFDELSNSNADADLGSCGIAAIPGTNRIFTGSTKFGSTFLLDSTNLGHFTSGGPDKVVQRFNGISNGNVSVNPVCWDTGSFKYVYVWPTGLPIRQFRYDPAVSKFNPGYIFVRSPAAIAAGGSLVVSANGGTNGILWAVGKNSVIHALNAADVSKGDYWNSSLNTARDGISSVGHFQFPTEANGKLYVPTGSGTIAVYGLLAAGSQGV